MRFFGDRHGLPWLDDLWQDVRHGVRTLRHTPVFTAVALLTLALGIGANTAIFSIVNGVILRPLGYANGDQLVSVNSYWPLLRAAPWLSAPEYEELRDASRSFARLGAFELGEANLTASDRPLRVRAAMVDAHLFAALGFQPAQGRFFLQAETNMPDGAFEPQPIAILSHELWQTALGGKPLLGRAVPINGRPHQILGIMPPGADVGDNRTEVWLPLGLGPDDRGSRGAHGLSVVGRLSDGVTVHAAEAELNAFLDNWASRFGVTATGNAGHVPTHRASSIGDHTLQIRSLQETLVGNAGRAIWVLQGAVGLVLLIACANLANLIIARAESRRREFAVRAALGASGNRLLRQTMTEGVLLSLTGGVLGLWVAAIGEQALMYAYASSIPRASDVAVDLPVLLFALALSMMTGVLFGLAPVAQRRAAGLVAALKEGGDRAAGRHYIRRALVIAEVALAVMLVIGAGLLVRTVYNLTGVDAGFDRSQLVTFTVSLPTATTDPDTRAAAYQRLLETVRAEPGVQAASAITGLPFGEAHLLRATRIENYTSPTGDPYEVTEHQRVMGDYFSTMGIAFVAGRGFEPIDVATPGGVVVVNETLAKRTWPGRNPIGQRLRPNFNTGLDGKPWHTVIGVVRDVKQDGADHETRPEIYVSVEEWNEAPSTMNVVLRTTLTPAALSATLDRLVKNVDSGVPVVRLRDMGTVFAESIRRPRLLARMLGGFGGLALLLAAIGTYGVLSYMVTERRREIGVRMALGAARGHVLALVMKQGLLLTVAGIIVGVAGALGVNRLLASLLFGMRPTDPVTIAAVIATIALVAALACWLPAWRASRLDPNAVLRAD
jgi:putative ABC transport system permease protein